MTTGHITLVAKINLQGFQGNCLQWSGSKGSNLSAKGVFCLLHRHFPLLGFPGKKYV
jgi:hypothetical protein